MSFYQIDPTFSIIYHDEDTVEFRSGVWNIVSHVLSDPDKSKRLAKIVLLLDEAKSYDVKTIAEHAEINSHDCAAIIDALKQKKVIIKSNSPQTQHIRALASLPATANDEVYFSRVAIIKNDRLSDMLKSLLLMSFPELAIITITKEQLSFITDAGESIFSDSLLLEKITERAKALLADTLLVNASTHINPYFDLLLNKVLHEAQIPWFYSAIDGPFVYVGPLFKDSFCFECLERRVWMNSRNASDYVRYKKAIMLNKIKNAQSNRDLSLLYLCSSLANIELRQIINTGRSVSNCKLLSVFLPTMEFSYHKILQLPGCRVCGVDNGLQGHQIHFDMGALLEL